MSQSPACESREEFRHLRNDVFHNGNERLRVKKLKVKAELKSLPLLTGFIRKSAESHNFTSETVNGILLACEEIIVNIINYAYAGKKHGSIEISIEYSAHDTLHITIADRGRPFDILSVQPPDITKPLEEREPGGLGIMLAKHFMDKVTYKHENGTNIVSLSKSGHPIRKS